MYQRARPRMDLLSFGLGIGCTILVQVTGALGLATRSLWGWAAQADWSWARDGAWVPSIGSSTVALASAVAAIAVLGAAWAASLRKRTPAAPVETAPAAPRSEEASSGIAAERDELMAQSRAQLEQQLADLMTLVVGYLERNSAYAAAVARVQNQLTGNASIDCVRQLVEVLIKQNADALRDARDLRGQLEHAREQASDIRGRLQEAERLSKLDALTSVANRRSLEEFLESEIAKSHQDQSPLCVVMTDIDHFKQVNDTHGHQMGDDVLKSFARLLQACSRETDLVARYGGEEFTLVLPRTPMGNAYQITDRLRHVLDRGAMQSVDSNQALAKVTASFGIAEIREDEHAAQLLHRADRMLFEAKKNGRNLVVTDSLDRLRQNGSDRDLGPGELQRAANG